MNLVAELFQRLENDGIKYAVIRNYENLPDLRVAGRDTNTDIDLVVDTGEVDRFRAIAKTVAEQAGWDAVTECDHFRQSAAQHHNIDVFRFYRLSPPDFLQVDLFHGYVVQALPFMTEQHMLADRCYSRTQQITHIDPIKENAYRLVQIYALWKSEGPSSKLERYGEQVRACDRRMAADLRRTVAVRFGKWGLRSIDALVNNDMPRFARLMSLSEAYFVVRYALAQPSKAAFYLAARTRERRLRAVSRPCGFVIRAQEPDPRTRARFVEAMDQLAAQKVFRHWSVRSSRGQLSSKDLGLMERGGTLVEWTHAEPADLLFSPADTVEEIRQNVMSLMITRHPSLFLAPRAVAIQNSFRPEPPHSRPKDALRG